MAELWEPEAPAGLADPEGLVGLVGPEDSACPAEPWERWELEDLVGPAGLAQPDLRPMRFGTTKLAIVTTRSSSASATRPTTPVSRGRT